MWWWCGELGGCGLSFWGGLGRVLLLGEFGLRGGWVVGRGSECVGGRRSLCWVVSVNGYCDIGMLCRLLW